MSRFRRTLLRVVLGALFISCFLSRFASGTEFNVTLKFGDSLLASNHDVLLSANRKFAVGFFPDVSNQSFYFGCWFTGECVLLNLRVEVVSDQ